MKSLAIGVLLLFPVFAYAGGLLGDVTKDIGRVQMQIDRPNAKILGEAAYKIERAEIAQSLQVDALTKRIMELEGTVKKQQELIDRYQRLVLELQAKVGGGK